MTAHIIYSDHPFVKLPFQEINNTVVISIICPITGQKYVITQQCLRKMDS